MLRTLNVQVHIFPHTSVVAGLASLCPVTLVVVVLLVVCAAASLAIRGASPLTIHVVAVLMWWLFSITSMWFDVTYMCAVIWCLWRCASLGPPRICEILEYFEWLEC